MIPNYLMSKILQFLKKNESTNENIFVNLTSALQKAEVDSLTYQFWGALLQVGHTNP